MKKGGKIKREWEVYVEITYMSIRELHNIIEKINIEFKKYTKIAELSYGVVGITTENINDKFNFEDWLKEVDQKVYSFKRKKKDGGNYKGY